MYKSTSIAVFMAMGKMEKNISEQQCYKMEGGGKGMKEKALKGKKTANKNPKLMLMHSAFYVLFNIQANQPTHFT